ncbi:MAG TPA: 30S ribosomal protein S13 [Candidatus Thermoplasmatota archaeon]|nr:30S ribosomal protein S13 [Candidatus Thermoplasmatota archaeon]
MAENDKSPEEKKQHSNKESTDAKHSEVKGTSEEKRKNVPPPDQKAAQPDQQKKKEKKGKQSFKGDEPAKKKEHDENFNYIIRIVNTDINGESNIVQGLTQIKGIGRHMATFIADTAGVERKLKFGNLPEPEIEKLKEVLENIDDYAPEWMLNYQKDMYTGEDIHLIGNDVTARLRDDINMMKMIRSYRGVRHELGLKVRGQRTSSNGRKGLALGVSKRREAPAASGKKEETKEK